MDSIPINLRQRALAAYKEAQERKRQEEIEQAYRAIKAHEILLRNLCQSVLQINPLNVQWLPESGYCWPVAEVEGLLFSCPPETDRLEILTCVSASNVFHRGTHITNIKNLGQILSDSYHKPCTIQDGLIIPANELKAKDTTDERTED